MIRVCSRRKHVRSGGVRARGRSQEPPYEAIDGARDGVPFCMSDRTTACLLSRLGIGYDLPLDYIFVSSSIRRSLNGGYPAQNTRRDLNRRGCVRI